MSFSPEHLSRHITPREAVADAMMVVQAGYLDSAIRRLGTQTANAEDLFAVVNKESNAQCYVSSGRVISFIGSKYSHLFPATAILSGEEVRISRHHGVFLALDRNNMWYAGSPANNTDNMQRFKKLYEAQQLDEILKRLSVDEGGIWPSKDKIINELKSFPEKYSPRVHTSFIPYIIDPDGV